MRRMILGKFQSRSRRFRCSCSHLWASHRPGRLGIPDVQDALLDSQQPYNYYCDDNRRITVFINEILSCEILQVESYILSIIHHPQTHYSYQLPALPRSKSPVIYNVHELLLNRIPHMMPINPLRKCC